MSKSGPSFALPEFPRETRRTLPNGLTQIVAPLPHLHTVAVGVYVRAGSRYETAANNGISHFLEHMFFRGTADHPSPRAWNQALESLGGSLSAATHTDFTAYELAIPPENLREGLALLGEAFRSPLFLDIETEKAIVREEILGELDEDGHDIDIENISRGLLFGEHPLALKIGGIAANIERFTHAELMEYKLAHYGATNLVIAASGAVKEDVFFDAAEAAFAGLPSGERRTSTTPSMHGGGGERMRVVDHRGMQSDVRLCFPTFGHRDPRSSALHVLSRILDDGLSTRVFRRIVEERGLAYEAFAGAETYEDAGAYDLGATVAHDKVADVLGELIGLTTSLRETLVGEDELAKAKLRHGWTLVSSMDDALSISSFYGMETLFGLERSIADVRARIAKVTPEDVRAVAQEVFAPARAHIAIVGNAKHASVKQAQTLLPCA